MEQDWCMMIDNTSSIFCETILWLASSRVYSIVSYLSSNFRLKQSRHTANHRPFLLQSLPPRNTYIYIYVQVLPLHVSQLSWLLTPNGKGPILLIISLWLSAVLWPRNTHWELICIAVQLTQTLWYRLGFKCTWSIWMTGDIITYMGWRFGAMRRVRLALWEINIQPLGYYGRPSQLKRWALKVERWTLGTFSGSDTPL